jgi:TonB family protein
MDVPTTPEPEKVSISPTASGEEIEELAEVSNFSLHAAPTLGRFHGTARPEGISDSAGKLQGRTSLRSEPKYARIPGHRSVLRPGWGAYAAVGILIGFASLSIEWITMRRDAQSEMKASLAQAAKVSDEAVRNHALPSVDRTPISPDTGEEKFESKPRSVEPLLAEEREPVPNPPVQFHDQPVRVPDSPPSNATLKIPIRPAKAVLARDQSPENSSSATANLKTIALEKVTPLPVGRLPESLRQSEPPTASPVTLASNSPTVEPKKLESLMLPAKQAPAPTKVSAAVAILADPYPSLRIPDGSISKKQRQATSLQLGHLLTRVEPVYPEEAKQQGIQGTVKLHAIIGREGAVQNLASADGSPVLVAAAKNAVRQWRYSETLLAGQSVETEEDIAITFRLSNSIAP